MTVPEKSAVEVLTGERAVLGESPLWHGGEQVFYWVDIVGRKVFRYDPVDGDNEVVFDGDMVTALGELDGGGLLMVTPEALLSFRDGAVDTFAALTLPDGVRTNDGKCDSFGRAWFGTMDLETSRPIGELFRFDGKAIHSVRDEIILSNGLGWSPSGDVFYHVDSIRRLLYAYRYDGASGEISDRRVLVDMTGRPEVPDGLAVDVDGNIWVAMYDGWCVNVFDRSGALVHVERLDVQKPTSVAFGGGHLSDLYVTTASQELESQQLDEQVNAGELLRLDPGTSGLPVGVFGMRTAS